MEQPQNKPKLTPTPSQEVSLQKFFNGTQAEREQVISIHNPEMQEKLRELGKSISNINNLFPILFSDLKFASGHMKAHSNDHSCEQFWRRTTIRTLAATLDGIVYCTKQNTIACAPIAGYSLSPEELFFLSEISTEESKKNKWRLPPFRDNFKLSFKLLSKVHNIPCTINFGVKGFEYLCEVYELRSGLMHPKSYWKFQVDDEQKHRAGEAIKWISEELMKFFNLYGS
jgi:hypothetical protein